MQIPVVVEPSGAGFVARAGAPFGWTAEGATADEAVAKLRERAAGVKVVTLDVPDGTNPWAAVAGIMKDVPEDVWQEYLKAVEEYRDQSDKDGRPW